jgi:hypothetical protein
MKRLLTLFTVVLFALNCFSQSKTFNGIVQDFYKLKRIDSVYIGAEYGDSLAITNKKGKFTINLPRHYLGTLHFTHPDYYPYYLKVKKIGDPHPMLISMIPRSIKPDTLLYSTAKGNKSISGKVYDSNNDQPIAGVNIEMAGHKVIAVTNSQGSFYSGIPENSRFIVASHPDYKPLKISFDPEKKKQRFSLVMERKQYSRSDTAWKTFYNEISITANEFFLSALGLHYQRYISFRHAVGLHFSWYFHGVGLTMNVSSSEYTGIRFSPYYRYYLFRSIKRNFFAEGHLSAGHFDFSKLYYGYIGDARYGEFYKDSFLTYGLGLGIGFSFILPKTKHGIINIYSGFRYFPMPVEQFKSSEYYGSLGVVDNWWYFYGPGSIVELKLTLGGIF